MHRCTIFNGNKRRRMEVVTALSTKTITKQAKPREIILIVALPAAVLNQEAVKAGCPFHQAPPSSSEIEALWTWRVLAIGRGAYLCPTVLAATLFDLACQIDLSRGLLAAGPADYCS